MVIVFEDAHWIDPTSRELLDLTIERVRSLPVLLIITFRPEFQPPWTGQPQVTMLALNRLDRRDQIALVAQITGGKALPAKVVDHIADRTDGVPLFVEELTKSVLESGLLREEADRYILDRGLPPFAIPTSLHDSLMARIDRLSSVRLVAQIGAAIGRQFPYALLCIISPYRPLGTIYRGWFKVINGNVAEGILLLRSGSAAYRATGQEGWMPHFIALVAAACEIAGQIEEALALLDEALQIVERIRERWLEAELNRHKGQLLLRQGHTEAAEELYRRALNS